MKKRKRIKLIVMALLVISMQLAGCFSKPTVESLFLEAVQKLNDINSGKLSGEFNMKLNCNTSSLKDAEMDANLTFKTLYEKDNGCYFNYNISVNEEGTHSEEKEEMYVDLSSNDKSIYYKSNNKNNEWIKEVSNNADNQNQLDNSLNDIKKYLCDIKWGSLINNLKLSSETEKNNKKKVYHISGEIKGGEVKEFIKSIGEIQYDSATVDDILSKIDLDSIVCNLNIYIDKKTKMLVECRLDFTKSNLTRLYQNIENATSKSLTIRQQEEINNTKINCEEFILSISLDNINKCSIPDDVKNNCK